MNLQRLFSMRAGQRATIENQLEELEKAKSDEQIEDFLLILESIEDLAASLKNLDDKIIQQSEADDIAAEMQQNGSYNLHLKMKIRRNRQFYQESISTAASNNTNQSSRLTTQLECNTGSYTESEQTTEVSEQTTGVSEQTTGVSEQTTRIGGRNIDTLPFRPQHGSTNNHKLPKLTLPTFNGNQLLWLSFWDSFETTVHNNPHLSDVEKFNYLKSQLDGDAARSIEGFSLTNANYLQAISLLKERYGKSHKIISAHMQALLQLPTPSCTLTDLRVFHDRIETNIRGLTSLGESQDNYGNLLVPIIMDKLPAKVREHLAREHGCGSWTLTDLLGSIYREIEVMDAQQPRNTHVQFCEPTASFHTGAVSKDNTRPVSSFVRKRHIMKKCVFCNLSHNGECMRVRNVQERLSIVKTKRLCFNCLSDRHQVSKCSTRSRCRLCKGKHHTSICERTEQNMPKYPEEMPSYDSRGNAAILHSSSRPDILLKTAIAPVCSNNMCVDTNILMDEGAQRSFITKKLAEELNLRKDGSETIYLTSFGDPAKIAQSLDTATVYIVANDGEKIPVRVLIVPVIAKPINNRFRQPVSTLKHLKGLKLAHPVTMETTFDISMLIGADYYWSIVGDRVVRGDGPTAVSSRLGYFLSGPLPASHVQTSSTVMDVIATHVAESTDLTRFWEIESMGVASPEIDDSIDYLRQYQDKNVSFSEGRYMAKLPWKPSHPPLPTNYSIAMKRTESTIRRMSKEPRLLEAYSNIIKDQEYRGFIERVPENSTAVNVHYIPHHGVKKDSATTPIRIVYDCSCRQLGSSPSLNDCLQSVPPELNNIITVLIRFRLGKFAVSTDIEKAFLHVGLHEDDRDVTRFFWLSDPADPHSPLVTYRFKVVLFGATCSPFILNAVLMKHIDRNRDNPAAHVISRDLYVDNIISSFTREKQVLRYFHSARDMMIKAGFNLREWCSNSEKLRKCAEIAGVNDSDNIAKILGMRWEPDSDQMSFVNRPIVKASVISKRSILQQTSRLYDPLGHLTPVTVRAKLLIQELWRRNFDWDTPLPVEVADVWLRIADDLNIAMKSTFSRQYFPTEYITDPEQETTLHVFVDSSAKSYGAVVYICTEKSSAFVISKNRVAPVKQLSLPRLELMAALLGARLGQTVKNIFTCKETVFWSDSQIVLHWLQSTKLLKKFVSNRVAEINQLSENCTWRYCNTKDNPADLLTRGISAEQLSTSTLWREGPEWICENRKWPSWSPLEPIAHVTVIETETGDSSSSNIHYKNNLAEVIEVSRYSQYRKLLRVTAYVLRFIASCKQSLKEERITGHLTVHELRNAEYLWLHTCQISHYSDIIENIDGKGCNVSIVRQLRLFLDENGIIRCGGRIHNAQLPQETKFPYLLPAKHPVTRLIILDAHYQQSHAGVNQTVTHIRQKYWIPAIRQCVKSVLRSCVPCRKISGNPYQAVVSPPLPTVRVKDESPFTVTGVDFSGSLTIKERTGEMKKAYICLFTCASTRAVHLEIVPDLTEESFMLSFRRFVSRRSVPKLMISDNATTFHAAANQIKRLFSSASLQTTLSERGTEWQFIPTRAPWYGGWWERMIGVTKTAMKKVLGRACVDMATLQTVITEIEAIINDRPLTYVSSSADDPEPLTPAHLLHGRRLTTLPFSDTNIRLNSCHINHDDVTRRARRHSQIIENYRYRWKHEYLTALREYHRRSGSSQQTIRVGDVIQVHDDFKTRLRWNLAIVEELITGNDGRARAARIRTTSGLTSLPIVKLYPLEILHTDTDIIHNQK